MQTIQRGLAPEREATTLQVLLQASGIAVDTDGRFGKGTEDAVRAFQQAHGLIVDGVAGEKTWTTLFALHPGMLEDISAKWLSQQDIDTFAARRALPVPVVRSVYSVESGGSGFVGTKPKILFEGHVFWQQLRKAGIDPKAHVAGNEDILFPEWDPSSYVGGLAEYGRLDRAKAIHPAAAMRSASWGMFQILGYHAESLGYADVQAFVDAMTHAEADHLDAFGSFITINRFENRPLIAWLKDRAWAKFAAGYNGRGYAKNKYDLKLAAAYAKFSAMA